jgi:hypothetical protein
MVQRARGWTRKADAYTALVTEITQQLETLDATGEPSAGAWVFGQWEAGALIEKRPPRKFTSTILRLVTEYANGGFKQVSGDYTYTSGDTSQWNSNTTEGPWFDKTIFSSTARTRPCWPWTPRSGLVITPNGLSEGQVAQLEPIPNVSSSPTWQTGFAICPSTSTGARWPRALRQAIACVVDKEFLTQSGCKARPSRSTPSCRIECYLLVQP